MDFRATMVPPYATDAASAARAEKSEETLPQLLFNYGTISCHNLLEMHKHLNLWLNALGRRENAHHTPLYFSRES
jgi:hypothetical protein